MNKQEKPPKRMPYRPAWRAATPSGRSFRLRVSKRGVKAFARCLRLEGYGKSCGLRSPSFTSSYSLGAPLLCRGIRTRSHHPKGAVLAAAVMTRVADTAKWICLG